jgi:hypothetical protein
LFAANVEQAGCDCILHVYRKTALTAGCWLIFSIPSDSALPFLVKITSLRLPFAKYAKPTGRIAISPVELRESAIFSFYPAISR